MSDAKAAPSSATALDNSNSDDGPTDSTPKYLIAAAVIGSLAGVLFLVLSGLYWKRWSRKRSTQARWSVSVTTEIPSLYAGPARGGRVQGTGTDKEDTFSDEGVDRSIRNWQQTHILSPSVD